MKLSLISKLMFLIVLLKLIQDVTPNKNKAVSRFDRHYNECKSQDCLKRASDEDCIYKCISKQCYEQIFSDYILELGEINYDLKSKF